MKSPVGMEEIETGSSSEDCYQLVKGIYVYAMQEDSSGRNLWIQQRKNSLDLR